MATPGVYLMAGAFDRVTWMLLLCSAAILPGSVTWTASVALAADAGAPGSGGGTAGEQAPAEEGPPEEAEGNAESEASEEAEAEAEQAEEAQPDESAEAELARQAAELERQAGELERQAAERAALQPPLVAEADENSGAPTEMGKRDFLRRLRTTAENIERGRTSERTEAHTDGDLTVLSNVGGPGDNTPEEPDVKRQRAQEGTEEAPARPNAESEKQDRETTAYANSVAARDRSLDEPAGQWHWLWLLGGLATALLLPIGILLTRATRSS